MIINTYRVYIATLHDGSPVIARCISESGWIWLYKGKQAISPELPEEHLKNFSQIVQGSMKRGWATETVYDVNDGEMNV